MLCITFKSSLLRGRFTGGVEMAVFEAGEALAEVLEDVADLIGGDEAILVLVEDVEGRR